MKGPGSGRGPRSSRRDPGGSGRPLTLFPDLAAPARRKRGRRTRRRRPAARPRRPNPETPIPLRPAAAAPPPPPAADRTALRHRALVVAAVLGLWGAVLLGRLYDVQILRHEASVTRAASQHRYQLDVLPLRGEITDRAGQPLAVSLAVDSVYVAPPDYEGRDLEEAAARLARCLDISRELVRRRLGRDSQFSWLKRKAADAEVACARDTGLPLGTIEEYGRFYPAGRTAAQVIGHVGVDGDGLGGVEYSLDAVIRGEPGARMVWTDGRQTGHGSRVVREAQPGANLELTLDRRIQAIAEQELARGISETNARAGAVLIVESGTGEVLAMASAPSFDPNRAGEAPPSTRVNRAITDPYEPGSVFKVFTAAAALNEGVTHENEVFDTFDGRYRVGSRTVRDWKPLGLLSFAGVVQRSSNIGTLQVGVRLGADRLERYLRAFGFGAPTGLRLGGESRGIVPSAGPWRLIRLATVSFGHGIAATAAQVAQGVNAIANGGILEPLRLVRRIGDEIPPPGAPRRVVSHQTAERVKAILAGAVEDGTGGAATVPGFEVAGKTGTAQKAVPGGYHPDDFIASFAGFVPAHAPRFTGVVILDTTRPNHSGANAARVFGRIASRLLRHYRLVGDGVETIVASDRERPAQSGAAGPRPRREELAERLRRERESSEGAVRVADLAPADPGGARR